MPLFVHEGHDGERALPSIPGVSSRTLDRLPRYLDYLQECGLSRILIFAIQNERDGTASAARRPDSLTCRAVRIAKQHAPKLNVMVDICVCQYTDHGHCRVVHAGQLETTATLEALTELALHAAQAGADTVMPSAMLPGSTSAIRAALIANRRGGVKIFSQGVKFASAYYGPFRQAAFAASNLPPDKRGYQLEPADRGAALQRARQEQEEGADVVLVKPAIPYLDVLAECRRELEVPLGVFFTSAEHAQLNTLSDAGAAHALAGSWLDSISRAGATHAISYFSDILGGSNR